MAKVNQKSNTPPDVSKKTQDWYYDLLGKLVMSTMTTDIMEQKYVFRLELECHPQPVGYLRTDFLFH